MRSASSLLGSCVLFLVSADTGGFWCVVDNLFGDRGARAIIAAAQQLPHLRLIALGDLSRTISARVLREAEQRLDMFVDTHR